MYIYASLYGEIRRFRAISWIEWLKKWQETGEMPKDLDRYSKHFGFLELSDMASWGPGDITAAREAIADRKRKRKHEPVTQEDPRRDVSTTSGNHRTLQEPGEDRKDPQ